MDSTIYTISAKLVKSTEKALLLDCENDKAWFPKSLVKFDESLEELSAPKWLLEKQIPDAKL